MDKWVSRRRGQQTVVPSCRLFCFPWGGGGTGLYSSWAKHFPGSIEVNPVCLPGREFRFKEKPYSDLELLIADLCEALLPTLQEKPFAFFGHSLGAIISFELACYLKTHHNMEPTHLFLSGATAPYSTVRQEMVSEKPVDQLTDDEFLARLEKLGGTPKEVMARPQLLKMYIPCIKADLMMLLHYGKEAPPEPILSCPINFFEGAEDTSRNHDIECWKTVTSGSFDATYLPGGHFYLQQEENSGKIIKSISEILAST
ncbi:S-acyl fatty acid synthase thioesterase, medium chain-like [Patiria miniata]|uniref:S-acyl fatty acid synthase thioesterase, medium chain n=1 Tax=Patiria miniata TaxID=46514 RepID=A0A913Z040_PATMI|nr:S-acyl fatty acid synthase thioesterase, medium chain-like [Patiria miniata]XP_038044353.1 S-acyl fatty acid synthase thioesterase, medium chain-like [Patiria miniata]